MAIKNVVVVGGGGNLGPSIVNALLTSPHGYNVSVLSRKISTYQPPSGVQLLSTDYTHESLVSVLKGQDAIVSTIGGQGIADQKKIIDAAIDAGVQRFLPSEFGSDTTTPLALEYFPHWGSKVEIRDYLKSKQDKIEWTAIFTGLFFDWGLKIGFIGVDLKNKTATIYPKQKDVYFSASTLGDIGKAVAQSLSPSIAPKTANQILRFRSVRTSQSEILAAFEELTGEKYAITEVDLEAEIPKAKESLKNGDFSAVGTLIKGAELDVRTGNDFDEGGRVSNDLLELPTVDAKSIIKTLV